jgi:hypothetical protein
MAGYAIQARIEGVRPRLTALGAPAVGHDADTSPAFVAGDDFTDPFAGLGDDPPPTLAERWDRGREIWSQTTFFLFDPNSWR